MTALLAPRRALPRERVLAFADGLDGWQREAVLELAGRWKHNWIPLDEIALAIKNKRMHGDGIRRSGAPTGAIGKSRLDPAGAKARALAPGGRTKAGPRGARPAAVAVSPKAAEAAHDYVRARGKHLRELSASGDKMATAEIKRRAARKTGKIENAANEQRISDSQSEAARDADDTAELARNASRKADAEGGANADENATLHAHAADMHNRAAAAHYLAGNDDLAADHRREEAGHDERMRALEAEHAASAANDTSPEAAAGMSKIDLLRHVQAGDKSARGELDKRRAAEHTQATGDLATIAAHPEMQGRPGQPTPPAAPLKAPKPPHNPSKLYREYQADRDAQMARFESQGKLRGTTREEADSYFGEGETAGHGAVEKRLTFADWRKERAARTAEGKQHAAAYNAGVALGKKHALATSGHENHDSEFEHAVRGGGHDEEMFSGGYGDGAIQAGQIQDNRAAGAKKAGATLAARAAERSAAKPKAAKETPEQTAARIGMTFPKPTVKSHALIGPGATVESSAGDAATSAMQEATQRNLKYRPKAQAALEASKHANTIAGHQAAAKAHAQAGHAALAAGQISNAQRHADLAGKHVSKATQMLDDHDAAIRSAQSQTKIGNLADKQAERAAQTPREIFARLEADPSKVSMAELQRLSALGGKFAPAANAEIAKRDGPAAVHGPGSGGHVPEWAKPGTQPGGHAPPEPPPFADAPGKGITIEHSGDGTVVHGTDRGDKASQAVLKEQGFKYSGQLGGWYLPRSWGEATRDQRVKAVQAKLPGASVTVGDRARSGTPVEQAAARVQAAHDSAERNTSRAARASAEADRRFGAARAATEGIPFGQPILVGHHSESKHRNALAKSDRNMRAGFEASNAADNLEGRAKSAAARAAREADPRFAARRLATNEAEVRKIERNLGGTPETSTMTGEWADRVKAMHKDLSAKIATDRATVASAGNGLGRHNVKPGDFVHYRGEHHMVTSANQKTVTVPSGHDRLAEAGHTDKIAYAQLTGHSSIDSASTESLQKLVDSTSKRVTSAVKARARAILNERKAGQ